MLDVDLGPPLLVLGTALVLAVAVRVALAIGAARSRRRGAALVESVPRRAGTEE